MLSSLFGGRTENQMLYGTPEVLYGVQSPPMSRVITQYFLLGLFFILVPVVLLVGTLVFAKKKQFSKKTRIWTCVVVLGAYFLIVCGVIAWMYFMMRVY